MKKLILLAISLMIAVNPSFAQTNKQIKQARKEAKAAVKQLNKEKFQMLELGSLENVLTDYFLKVHDGAQQIIGTADNCKNLNIGKTIAMNNAINEFSSNAGGIIRGRVTSEISNIDGVQTDNLVAGFERELLKEMKGEVKIAVTLVKKHKDNVDVRIYCLIDPNAAHNAKMKAMQNAMEEQKVAQEFGSKISEWIKED